MNDAEAAVDEDGDLVFLDGDIRASRHIPDVLAESVSPGVQPSSDHELDAGVLSSNPGHDFASFLIGEHISHRSITRGLHFNMQGWDEEVLLRIAESFVKRNELY